MTKEEQIYEPVVALETMVILLSTINIPYFLVGSFASGIRGEFRATNDIDLVCKFDEEKILPFITKAQPDFFCDEVSIPTAIKNTRSFNLIHRETFIKVDCFTLLEAFELDQLTRATAVKIPRSQQTVQVGSAEYNILAKLRWYEKSNRVLDRQLTDVKSMIEINRDNLDLAYLSLWSERLHLKELLQEVLSSP